MAFTWRDATRWLARKAAGSPDWGTLERYLGWAFGGGISSSGVIVNPQNAMQAAAVYACIKVLSESVGMLPLNVYRKGEGIARTRDEQHPLWELLHWQPNEYQTSTEFLEMLVAHLNLRGNAYGYVNRTRSGRVVEIIPLHPDFINVRMTADNEVIYLAGTETGAQRQLDRSEVLHIKGLTVNGWLGVSPIAYAREAIGLALATEKYGGQLFRNGAKMGGVLEMAGSMSDVAYNRLKDSFDAATSGENTNKTQILEEGAKFSKVSMTGDEAQFLETRKYQRAEIAGLFRVPAHMINDLEHATFSNIEHMSLQFVQYCLMPWLVRIQKAMRRDLFSAADKKSHLLEFGVDELQKGDLKSRATYNATAIQWGWMTRNEARAGDGRNPLPGLDVPLVPLNMADGTEDPDDEETEPQAEPGATKPKPGGMGGASAPATPP